jgi:translocator protein
MPTTILALILWLAISFVPGLIGSQFMPGPWYVALQKPSWTPPGAVFGPVWTILYISMGIAAWLVWRRAGFSGAPLALGLFLVQLIFNGLWSYLFFGLHQPGLAFVEIVLLWVLILATLIAFWRVQPAAGALLAPYLLWVSFASVLNFQLWRLNA